MDASIRKIRKIENLHFIGKKEDQVKKKSQLEGKGGGDSKPEVPGNQKSPWVCGPDYNKKGLSRKILWKSFRQQGEVSSQETLEENHLCEKKNA